MTKRRIFARFVVNARDDADIWGLSHEAFRLWWSAILWCRDKGNDGEFPASIISALAPIKRSEAPTKELERAGFWIPNGGSTYVIRNYGEYQDDAAKIAARKAASAAGNGTRWG